MRTTKTFSPPANLRAIGPRSFVGLVLPFGEAADPEHELRGKVYEWATSPRLPKDEVAVLDGHDGQQIGVATGFTKNRSGVWALLKFGNRGGELVRAGRQGLSVEIDGHVITGVALADGGWQVAFSSARLYSGQGAVLDEPKAALRFGVDPSTGLVAFRPPVPTRAPARAPSSPAVVNLSEHRRLLAAVAGPDPEREVARARAAYQDRLESAREAQTDWEAVLVENARTAKTIFEARLVAAAGVEHAEEWKARHEALVARAERARRRWWRWWK